ncbi:serpin-ZX [Tanacetum coccineum]
MQKKIGCFNEGLPQLTSPGGKERRKLTNQSSSATYLHPGYGAASLGMASFTGVTTPGEANKCATGSYQLHRPDGTHDALFNQCLLVHLDLQLRRCRMAFCESYLVDGFADHIRYFGQALKVRSLFLDGMLLIVEPHRKRRLVGWRAAWAGYHAARGHGTTHSVDIVPQKWAGGMTPWLNSMDTSSYQKFLETVYKTKASSVDFGNKRDEAVDVINSWVNKETKGLIRFIVEKSDLDQESAMLIANAMYFKGIWSNPFDADDTIDKKFHLINGEQVSVPFMTSDKIFGYGSFDDYKMIKLPYKSDKGKSNKFSMYIFLPHEKAGLKKLLQNFHSNDALFHGKFDLTRQKFDELWIPKFKISCKFEAKDVMKQMGLTLPFEEKNKELSGIVEPDVMLYVSKILQKSFVEVDERGTKAAACSVVYGRTTCAAINKYRPPPLIFVADHPFMFIDKEELVPCCLLSS